MYDQRDRWSTYRKNNFGGYDSSCTGFEQSHLLLDIQVTTFHILLN
jgi:hypothetical protein